MCRHTDKIKQTELFQAMKSRNPESSDESLLEDFNIMLSDVSEGEDPEEVLHQMGFEPDYIFDLIGNL